MFKYWIYKFGQFWVTHLPLSVSYRIAVWMSDIHYFLSFRDRKAVKGNLQVVLKDTERLDLQTREVFRNFGKYLVEFFRMSRYVDHDFIKANVRIENLERIPEALKKGKGAIILTAHIGNWELGGVILSRLGYSSLAIALPHKERPVNNLFNQQRELQGIKIVPLNQSIRKSLEALNQNQCVAVLADRNFTPNGEIIEFLGRPVLFPKGPAIFSLRTGAPIIPTFFLRDGNRGFILTVDEPIYPPAVHQNGTLEREQTKALMEKYARIIEAKIRQCPTQWLMFRKFWVD